MCYFVTCTCTYKGQVGYDPYPLGSFVHICELGHAPNFAAAIDLQNLCARYKRHVAKNLRRRTASSSVGTARSLSAYISEVFVFAQASKAVCLKHLELYH